MPELPAKKVGIIACSGEELAAGTVTRQAALQVLERLRPQETVTICLPLFVAGGEGDRAFARFYPTIAVDGCDMKCAARATERYSGAPAASIVVTDVPGSEQLLEPTTRRRLDQEGWMLVDAVASQITAAVDELLTERWSRRQGQIISMDSIALPSPTPTTAACGCGSGIPAGTVIIAGQPVQIAGLPLIFQQFKATGAAPSASTTAALMDQLKIYNPIPDHSQDAYRTAISQEYHIYWGSREPTA